MGTSPFEFLLDLPEADGRQWLARYLMGETTAPPVQVPFDLQRLEFLLGEVNPLPNETLPRRVGDLAGGLLAEAIIRGAHRTGEVRFLKALFTLLESLPASQKIEEFLNDLVVSGRLLGWPAGDGADFHLLTLRALVLHWRPVTGQVERLIELWKREARDLRYAPIAIQGLLRVSVAAAIDALPDFVDRALAARPTLPVANTLFAVSVELGDDKFMWEQFVRVFDGHPRAFETVKDTFSRTGLAQSNPVAWQVLQTPTDPPRRTRASMPIMFMAGGAFSLSLDDHAEYGPWRRRWENVDFAEQDDRPLSAASCEERYAA